MADDQIQPEPKEATPVPTFKPGTRAQGFCRKCQRRLLPEFEMCRGCGTPFSWTDPTTYLKQPHFIGLRFWFPGFCLAVACGVISYAVVMQTGQMGVALFVSVPVSFGAILGFGTRTTNFVLFLLGLVAVLSVILALVTVNLAGFFCGATLGLIFLLPALFGILCGVALRSYLKGTQWDQRRYLPLVMFAAIPYGCELIENKFPRPPVTETILTGLTIDATPEEAWRALMFYEDVRHAPPWLLHLALPKPLRSQGRKRQVGDRVRCVYDSGELNKQITAVDAPRKLAFKVTLQRVGAERYVALEDGSLEFVPVGVRQTRIVLTTRYRRWLRPDFFWLPIEREVVETLHEHVIEGIELEAKRAREAEPRETPDAPADDLPLARR